MSKALCLVGLGLASTNAYWSWPASQNKQYMSNFAEWTSLDMPTAEDYPFSEEAEWNMQAMFLNNDANSHVNGWYHTDGFFTVETDYAAGLGDVDMDGDDESWMSYTFRPMHLGGNLQFTIEIMKMYFLSWYIDTTAMENDILTVTLTGPRRFTDIWDDKENNENAVGFMLSSYGKILSMDYGVFGAGKSCLGDLLAFMDEEEEGAEALEAGIACSYLYTTKNDWVTSSSTLGTVGWAYAKDWELF